VIGLARDYRLMGKYDVEKIYFEKLESKEWLGKRLSFLWDIKDQYSDDYFAYGLSEEKNIFYKINDNDVLKIASEDYHSINKNLYINIDIKTEYRRLKKLKKTNRKEFLLKKNVHMYEYIISNYDLSELSNDN